MKRLAIALFAVTGLSVGASQIASAADLPMKAPPMVAAPVPFSWAGFYIGANAGGGLGNGPIDDEDEFYVSTHATGGFGTIGGQIGYNWQWRSAVAGIEADGNWTSFDPDVVICNTCGNPFHGTLKFDGYTSVRARMGLALDNVLVYVTGGPAWGHLNASFVSQSKTTGTIYDWVTDDSWHFGVAAGAGVEAKLSPAWSVGLEYLHLAFEKKDVPYIPNTAVGENPRDINYREGFSWSGDVVRVRANYQFDVAPLMAK